MDYPHPMSFQSLIRGIWCQLNRSTLHHTRELSYPNKTIEKGNCAEKSHNTMEGAWRLARVSPSKL